MGQIGCARGSAENVNPEELVVLAERIATESQPNRMRASFAEVV